VMFWTRRFHAEKLVTEMEIHGHRRLRKNLQAHLWSLNACSKPLNRFFYTLKWETSTKRWPKSCYLWSLCFRLRGSYRALLSPPLSVGAALVGWRNSQIFIPAANRLLRLPTTTKLLALTLLVANLTGRVCLHNTWSACTFLMTSRSRIDPNALLSKPVNHKLRISKPFFTYDCVPPTQFAYPTP
jgi:hypothetical protein